jgi:hypothetical protein
MLPAYNMAERWGRSVRHSKVSVKWYLMLLNLRSKVGRYTVTSHDNFAEFEFDSTVRLLN